MMDQTRSKSQRNLAFQGALMMALGMVYGLYVALVMTGKAPGHAEIALGSHINALFGSLWLLTMAWSLKFVVLSPPMIRLAIWSTCIGAWANWIVSAIKAVTGDVAIEFSGTGSNDGLFSIRIAFVIVPCLVGPALWAWGLRPGARH